MQYIFCWINYLCLSTINNNSITIISILKDTNIYDPVNYADPNFASVYSWKRNWLNYPRKRSLIRRNMYIIVFSRIFVEYLLIYQLFIWTSFYPFSSFWRVNLYKLTFVFVDIFTRSIFDRNFCARSFVCIFVSCILYVSILILYTRKIYICIRM